MRRTRHVRSRKSSSVATTLLVGVLLCVVLGVSGFASSYTLSWPLGWQNPLVRSNWWTTVETDTNYNFDSSAYRANWGSRHTGVDLKASPGTPVYAIAAGTVVRVTASADPMKLVVIMQHSGSRGLFLCVYGHISAIRGLVVGTRLSAGSQLGVVMQAGSPSHLHFGINTVASAAAAATMAWGRSGSTDPRTLGWVDPVPYLQQTLRW
jgi:murein DD-endopeptidase MepM/ murein hydrolase activator NlpD